MEMENFISLLRDIKPQRVTFAGRGEPLLNRNIVEMVDLVKKSGAKAVITSNFTTGERHAEELVLKHLDSLRISIDAATPDVYEKIRGKDLFDRIIKGIELVNNKKKSNGYNHPFVGFEFVMTQDNIHQVRDVVELAGKLEIDHINFRALGLVGIEDRNETIMGDAEKGNYKKLLTEAGIKSEELKVKTNIQNLMQNLDFYWNRYNDGASTKPIGCLYLWLQIFVSAEGEITPCCALFMDEGVTMGNVFKNGFDSVWNGEKFKEFRNQMKIGNVPYKSCNVCIPKDLNWIYKKVKLVK